MPADISAQHSTARRPLAATARHGPRVRPTWGPAAASAAWLCARRAGAGFVTMARVCMWAICLRAALLASRGCWGARRLCKHGGHDAVMVMAGGARAEARLADVWLRSCAVPASAEAWAPLCVGAGCSEIAKSRNRGNNKVLPRIELGLPDSESDVLTTRPQDHENRSMFTTGFRTHYRDSHLGPNLSNTIFFPFPPPIPPMLPLSFLLSFSCTRHAGLAGLA